MQIPSIYWTILGEAGLLLIGVLGFIVFFISKDRKKLKEYMVSLKETIKELKKKLQDSENEQSQERILILLNELIEYIHELHTAREEEAKDNDSEQVLSIDNFIIVAVYQTLITARNALENSNEAQASWEKIKNELTPLIQNYLEPLLPETAAEVATITEENNDEELKNQLKNANQRLENLKQFKQLYFELQAKLTTSVAEIEALNQKIADLAAGSENYDDIMAIIEKNKTQYINMGQMIAMDKEAHHESVSNSMDYSDHLINERKDEIKRLKHQISGQFEEIWALQSRLSDSSGKAPAPSELTAGIEVMARQLKDSEMCIETMDMEIQTLTSELTNLKNKLNQQGESQASTVYKSSVEVDNELKKKDQMIARFAQESKELLTCITGMEDQYEEQVVRIKQLESQLQESQPTAINKSSEETDNELKEKDQMIARFAQESKELLSCITGMEDQYEEQVARIKQLESQLEESKILSEKYSKLETEYSSMEEKYLEIVNKK